MCPYLSLSFLRAAALRCPLSSTIPSLHTLTLTLTLTRAMDADPSPLLCSPAQFRCVMEPVASSQKLSFHRAWVDRIDIPSKTLELTGAQPPMFREVDPLLPPEEQQQLGVPIYTRPPAAQTHRPASSSASGAASHPNAQQAAHITTTSGPVMSNHSGEEQLSVKHHRPSSTLKFDKLIIAHGSYNRTFNTPGVKANALFLKDVNNGRQIRWRLVSCLEQASNPDLPLSDKQKLLTWIVVGGGPTGSELIGELTDLVSDDIRRRFPDLVPHIKLILIDAGKKILSSFDAELAEYAREHFVTGKVDVRLERHITGVSPGVLHIKEDGDIPYGMLVWSTGVTASPLTRSIRGIKKESRGGALLTDDRLHALVCPPGEEPTELLPLKPDYTETETQDGQTGRHKYEAHEDIFAIGDAAVIQGEYLPATAQVAKAKAKYVASLLNRDVGHVRSCDMPPEPKDDRQKALRGRVPEPQPFEFQSKGQMSSLGSHAAIFQNKGWRGRLNMVKGPPAWYMWRSAYSLMSSNRNRVAVPFGWFLKMVFGRDLSRF